MKKNTKLNKTRTIKIVKKILKKKEIRSNAW